MAESKQPKKRHIKAARDWLRRAEQSFEREDEARGDLNVMLARAELKRAAETKAAGRRGRLRGWAKECLAAGAALVLVAAGALFSQPESLPASLPQVSAPDAQRAAEIPLEKAAPLAPTAPEAAAAKPRETVQEPLEKEENEQAALRSVQQRPAGVALPEAQMRRVMREAGKSLRGQPPFGNE